MLKNRLFKKLSVLLISFVMILGLLPVVSQSVRADGTDHYLVFATDRHSSDTAIGESMEKFGLKEVEYVCLAGDLVDGSDAYDTSTIIGEVNAVFANKPSIDIVWGTHDINVNADQVQGMEGETEIVYGAKEGTSGVIETGPDKSYYVYGVAFYDMEIVANAEAATAAFKTWVDGIEDKTAPIFVVCHMPIHYKRGDNKGSDLWVKAMNYAATGAEDGTDIVRDVFFTAGHNHTTALEELIVLPGETLSVQGESEAVDEVLKFTYFTAGYLRDNKASTLVTIADDKITLTHEATANATEYEHDYVAEITRSNKGESKLTEITQAGDGTVGSGGSGSASTESTIEYALTGNVYSFTEVKTEDFSIEWQLYLKDDGSYALTENNPKLGVVEYPGAKYTKNDDGTVEVGPMNDGVAPGKYDWADPKGFKVKVEGSKFVPFLNGELVAELTTDTAAPGEYTFEESKNDGAITMKWTLTVNEDGTYNLHELHSMLGDLDYPGSGVEFDHDVITLGAMTGSTPGKYDWANPAGFKVAVNTTDMTFEPIGYTKPTEAEESEEGEEGGTNSEPAEADVVVAASDKNAANRVTKDIEIAVGETKTIKIYYYSSNGGTEEREFAITSEDPAIATAAPESVSCSSSEETAAEFTITGVAEGETVINCIYAPEGGKQPNSTLVNVKVVAGSASGEVVKVVGSKDENGMETAEIEMKVGDVQEVNLFYYSTNNATELRNFVMTVDQEGIVTVDPESVDCSTEATGQPGVFNITAVAEGKAVITCTYAPEGGKKPNSTTITVTVTKGDAPAPSGDGFSDVTADTVSPGSLKSITWAVESGIVKGYKDGTFKPEDVCTREQFSIMLWRFAGEPAADIKSADKFSDIGDFTNDTAKKAVAWAVEQGILVGFNDGTFKPLEDITRAQVSIMLWRFAEKPAVDKAESKFSDIGGYSANVQNAIIWAEGAGIAAGYEDGTFKPDDGCQRQHMAIFLYRFNDKVKAYK